LIKRAAARPQPTTNGKLDWLLMRTKPIPVSGEALPVIGLGTYRGFDVSLDQDARSRLAKVLDALFAAGGRLIDSSPMYGRAEQVVGELLAQRKPRSPKFLATKVWTSGREAGIRQIEQSFRLLKTDCIDLMQIHNLVDWKTHLPTLRGMKEAGRIRYIGITHYVSSAYAEIERLLANEPMDFLQINYSLDDRSAAQRILPLAQDKGVAVLCNMPFGGGQLVRRLHSRPLPHWADAVEAKSWAQLALRFVLAHPAITCAIPGTGNPVSMIQNAEVPDAPELTQAQMRELAQAI
jgi:diketogulonate reductase-like aldo/keto reductase